MCLWLVKNGVPYETALALEERELIAHYIVMGEHEGGTWDWGTNDWKPLK
jgi:hypothetical protein